MKKYEIMFIVRPTLGEDEVKKVIKDFGKTLTTNGAKITNENDMGQRELAYEIKGETKGYYVLLNVTAVPEAIKEFERVANIKENIIRYIAVVE